MEVDTDGDCRWRDSEGRLYRDGDLPAITYPDGARRWWKHDELHRDGDHPAVIYADGSRSWWRHDRQHRDGDHPAAIYPNGSRSWWKRGSLHRDGALPAIICADSTCRWFKHGVETKMRSESETVRHAAIGALRRRLYRVDTAWARAY